MTHPYLDTRHPIAFSHRGAAEACGENTGDAIQTAVDLGYRWIETDVQATSDGVAVLFHDDDCPRLLGLDGRIGDYTWTELHRREVAGGGHLVRLDAVLSDFPDLRLNIDAKTDDVVGPMGDAIEGAGAVDRVCAASFDIRRTRALRERFGPALCWSPAMGGAAALWARGWGLPVPGEIAPCYQVPTHWRGIPVVTPRVLDAAHRAGAQVHVWTIDDAAEMERLLDLGVDGLMTDRPRVLRDVMQKRGHWPTE